MGLAQKNSIMNRKTVHRHFGIFSIAALLLLLIAGCTPEETAVQESNNDDKILHAIIWQEEMQSRSVVTDIPGIKAEVRWEAGDKIGVFGTEKGKNLLFTIGTEDILENGKKGRFRTTGDMPSGDVTAYYPYQKEATLSTGGGLSLTFPATQPYHLVERVSQPYAPANFMAGKGSSSGIGFRNLFALLKMGYSGSEGDKVEKIVFRDLSGKPVSGTFTVTWNETVPRVQFPESGTGNALTLSVECGEGVELDGNTLHHFYLFIPPRDYEKGFEVKLVMAGGKEVIKTIGSVSGKKIERSKVYPVGETMVTPDGVEYELRADVTLMGQKRMDYIVDARLNTYERRIGEAKFETHTLFMTVEKAFAPMEGEILLFDSPSELFPEGYLGRIVSTSNPDNDYITVVAEPVTDIGEVFEQLTMGDPIWNEDGSFNEEGGVEVDLSSYLSRVETADGENVAFTRSGESVELILPSTRASVRKNYNYSTGNINFTLEPSDNSTLDVTASMHLGMKMLVGVFDSKLHYFHVNISPDIRLSADLTLDLEGNLVDKQFHLLTAYFTPIPIPPLTVVPVIHFYGVAGLGGSMEIVAGMSYTTSMNLGFSYQRSEGFTTRCQTTQSKFNENGLSFPDIDVTSSFHATAGMRVDAGVKVWGVMQALCSADARMKIGSIWSSYELTRKMALNTETTIKGTLTTLGGIFNHESDELSLETDPIWERYFTPRCDISASNIEMLDDGVVPISITLKYKVTRHIMESVGIGAILYRGEPYGYTSDGSPYGFKNETRIMDIDFGASYIGKGQSRKEGAQVIFDDYEFFEHTFSFDPEPGVRYGILPAYYNLSSRIFSKMPMSNMDYYGLNYFTFVRPEEEQEME